MSGTIGETWEYQRDVRMCDFPKKSRQISWVTFSLNGKEIAAFTVKGMAPGEIQATVELLAHERGVEPSDIIVGTR